MLMLLFGLENGVCVDNYSMSVPRNRPGGGRRKGGLVSCGGFQVVSVFLPLEYSSFDVAW